MLSLTEENYLKAIYHLSQEGGKAVLTNEIADAMNTKAASVTDMIRKLSAKALISYEKYYGVEITKQGRIVALAVIRKHRLWETFLVQKLGFNWDQVHEVAEQLEHIQSPLLIEKLDALLGHPSVDPHGDPIPDEHGKIKQISQLPIALAPEGGKGTVCSVRNSSASFLQYLNKIGIHIGTNLLVQEKVAFDGSLEVIIDGKKKALLSREASENILIMNK